MPDYTNSELMEFICRVLKKVHSIESKLDQFLGIKEPIQEDDDPVPVPSTIQASNEDPHDKVDLTFHFNPINDEEELKEVTELINKDPRYLRNLRLMMQFKRNFCLEDVFTERFLLSYNLSGVYGKKKLEDLVPYEKVYVYNRKLQGEDNEYIRKFVMNEIHRIKKRVSRRIRHREHSSKLKSYEGLEEGQIPVDHEYGEIEFNEDSISFNEDDPLLSNIVKNELIDENAEFSESESNEPLIQLVPSTSAAVNSPKIRKGFPYEPINTKKEQIIVDERIEEDPEYLEKLRKHFSSKSRDNVCRLDQLFTPDFLHSFNYSGMHDREKLTDLQLYQQVYFHLKRIKGETLEDIEYDTKLELRRIKKRVYSRLTKRVRSPPAKITKF